MKKLIPFSGNLCSKHAEKMVSIKINSACNMKCSFCVDRDGRDSKLIDVNKIASEANKLDEYQTVIITGGEPFLNFGAVLSLASMLRRKKKRIVLNTNGSLLSRGKVEKLNGLVDEIQVSIHHYEQEKNSSVFGKMISFENIKQSLEKREFAFSVNSTFNNSYADPIREIEVDGMIKLTRHLGANNLRLTELKKVDDSEFVPASNFFIRGNAFAERSSLDLIEKGCTDYYKKYGVNVSVKRLCEYAKGKNAEAFSCCFINLSGQKKIDVDTEDTFKVIYGDGLVTDDWVFNSDK